MKFLIKIQNLSLKNASVDIVCEMVAILLSGL